jgi:hypothetical protein
MTKQLLLIIAVFTFGATSAQLGTVQPPNIERCSLFNFESFNLSAQTSIVLGSLPASDYTVTYHLSLSAANGDTDAISNPTSYINASNPQLIYVRTEQNSNPANFEVESFSLILDEAPYVFEQNFETCDLDGNPGDGLTFIDLEQVAEQVYYFGSIIPTDMEVTFYLTMADAQTQANGLESPFVMTSVGQTIYARCMYYSTGCVTVIPITFVINNCTGQCLPPQDLTATNITGSGATFGWNAVGTETQWEILVLYSGGPFPLPTMDGLVVSTNPVTITGLECPESFDVYVRAVCGTDISDWSDPVLIQVSNCNGGGQPVNLTACAESGSACFDLTTNTSNILGNLPASGYTVTYYNTSADASAGTNPIANPTSFCTTLAMGTTNVYGRLFNIATSEVQVVGFTVTAQQIINATTPLQSMIQCDADSDGFVTFDLTVAASQIGSGNSIVYYLSSSNAIAEINPIANPSVYTVSTQNPLSTIFIRETVPGSCDIIHSMSLNAPANCNLANVCAGANSLCNALGVPFANTTGIDAAEPGNAYGCLSDTPNPTWFYLPVSGNGTINLMIEQGSDIDIAQPNLDVDFICYGPFTDPVAPCSGMLTANKIVSCSYSAETVEFPVIPNAQAGQFYIIMTTNFSNEPGYVRITETGSSQGEIDCTGLRLNAFLDSNSNGTKEAGEPDFSLGQFHYEVNNNGVEHNITSPTGIYRIYDLNATNSYDISYTLNPLYTSFYGISTASFTDVSVVAGAGLQDYAFPITVTQSYNDVAVTIVPDQAPRPGFTYTNTILYSNLGSQTVAAGSITFVKDPLVTIPAAPAGSVSTVTGFTYNFTNLLPFETREIVVTMQVPLIPTVQLGNFLTNSAEILPNAGDASPENNSAISSDAIIGSYDPNDKMEAHGNQILVDNFASQDYLYYTIRFENTGTASAINVRVTDVLTADLDESTIEMVSASHNYTMDRVGSQLVWHFENVLLPPTIEDPVGSHGYIHFKVKPRTGYAAGDIIPNTASIVFDFNPAIVTNTFETHFVDVLATSDIIHTDFAVYPNPADDHVTVSLNSAEGSIMEIFVYDMLGKKVLDRKPSGDASTEVLDISGIRSGIYLIEVSTSNSKSIKKLIIE